MDETHPPVRRGLYRPADAHHFHRTHPQPHQRITGRNTGRANRAEDHARDGERDKARQQQAELCDRDTNRDHHGRPSKPEVGGDGVAEAFAPFGPAACMIEHLAEPAKGHALSFHARHSGRESPDPACSWGMLASAARHQFPHVPRLVEIAVTGPRRGKPAAAHPRQNHRPVNAEQPGNLRRSDRPFSGIWRRQRRQVPHLSSPTFFLPGALCLFLWEGGFLWDGGSARRRHSCRSDHRRADPDRPYIRGFAGDRRPSRTVRPAPSGPRVTLHIRAAPVAAPTTRPVARTATITTPRNAWRSAARRRSGRTIGRCPSAHRTRQGQASGSAESPTTT